MTTKTAIRSSPLVHILGLGLLLGLSLVIAKGPPTAGDEARRVMVTRNDLAHLTVGFMRTWNRAPTAEELRGELEKFIREEVLYREALARGYDTDDPVVRRAMQRKMEFLGESQVAAEPPTDEEIRAYFALRQEKYRTPAVISFAQIYFNPESRAQVARDARAALEELRRANPGVTDLDRWGDRSMLQGSYSKETEQAVSAAFGDGFAGALAQIPLGVRQGPIESAYGLHLVRVTERTDSRIPDWTEVREQVTTDMEYEARNAAREQMFQEIAQQYRIVLDDEVKAVMGSDSK